MKPIENIFGFDCSTCEHNRHCYGGNIGNQFRYCEKSAKKIQNLDNLEQENKQLKDNWNKLKEIAKSQSGLKKKCHNGSLWFEVDDLLDKMQELEGSDNNGIMDKKSR